MSEGEGDCGAARSVPSAGVAVSVSAIRPTQQTTRQTTAVETGECEK